MSCPISKISIIVPHKNSPDKLMRLLKSIPKGIPVIVVDDASGDKVLSGLRENISKQFSNVTLIDNKTGENNAGVARNVGLKHINSEWLIFADADDEFITDGLIEVIDRADLESKDVIFFNVTARKEPGGGVSYRCDPYRRMIDNWPSNREILPYCWPMPWGRMIRNVGFIDKYQIQFESRIASNDVVFSARLASAKPRVQVLNVDGYMVYESPTSLTATIDPLKALDRLEASINKNIIIRRDGISVRNDLCIRYFYIAIPLIIRLRKLDVLKSFIKNLMLSNMYNLKQKKR